MNRPNSNLISSSSNCKGAQLTTLESQRKELENSDPTGNLELQKLALQIKSATDACQEVQQLIGEHDQRIAALRTNGKRERKLQAGREALVQRQTTLLGDIDTLERLRQSTSYLLTSTSAIEPATPATLSNFKKLAVALFGLCGLVFLAPLLVRDGLTARRLLQSSDAYRAAELGVPLLRSPQRARTRAWRREHWRRSLRSRPRIAAEHGPWPIQSCDH